MVKLIRRHNELRVDKVANLRGGHGTVEVVNFFNEEDFAGLGRLFGISIIQPGDSVGLHEHHGEQEAYFILEGVGTYDDNGTEVKLYPGDLSLCRDGERHAIRNDAATALKYVALISNTR